jgi:hypothetical protein
MHEATNLRQAADLIAPADQTADYDERAKELAKQIVMNVAVVMTNEVTTEQVNRAYESANAHIPADRKRVAAIIATALRSASEEAARRATMAERARWGRQG